MSFSAVAPGFGLSHPIGNLRRLSPAIGLSGLDTSRKSTVHISAATQRPIREFVRGRAAGRPSFLLGAPSSPLQRERDIFPALRGERSEARELHGMGQHHQGRRMEMDSHQGPY